MTVTSDWEFVCYYLPDKADDEIRSEMGWGMYYAFEHLRALSRVGVFVEAK